LAAALSAGQPTELGKASGISNTFQRFGAVFGIAIVTAVFDAKGSLATQVTITNGYRPALAVAAGFSVILRSPLLPCGRREPQVSQHHYHNASVGPPPSPSRPIDHAWVLQAGRTMPRPGTTTSACCWTHP
jgi:hypothetical protein